jgi:DNA-binding transcriptional LysR family regulator
MRFRQLRTFRVVAETLNFTQASTILHLAQSSVSAQISGLEDDLQVQLFDRIGRSVTLTEAGETLLEYASRIDGMTEEIKGVLRQEQHLSGELVIRVPETIASLYIPDITEIYLKRNPDVTLRYINCSDLQLAKELRSGRLDLAFLMTDELSMANVDVEFLREEPLTMIAAEQHPFHGMDELSFAHLEGETLLMPKTD